MTLPFYVHDACEDMMTALFSQFTANIQGSYISAVIFVARSDLRNPSYISNTCWSMTWTELLGNTKLICSRSWHRNTQRHFYNELYWPWKTKVFFLVLITDISDSHMFVSASFLCAQTDQENTSGDAVDPHPPCSSQVSSVWSDHGQKRKRKRQAVVGIPT